MLNSLQPSTANAASFSNSPGSTVVPDAFGNAIPTNSKDLLKYIRAQKLNKHSGTSLNQKAATNGQIGNLTKERLKMLDEQRETLELRMMAREDHLWLSHEAARMERLNELEKMETEDVLSSNLTIIFKEYDYERFKASLLKQVELREAKEKEEREAKRRAAEERRKAVVERLRLQAEMEERRKREAEEAIKRIEEEEARKELWERNRLASDHALMQCEDQLSMLVEQMLEKKYQLEKQEYEERMERERWQQREREKLLAWEEEQKQKDIIEEEKRKLRLAELEEKKKKLAAIRQQQQQQQQISKNGEANMKDEQERLNRQLRIQNKAKFISKRAGQQTDSSAIENSDSVTELSISTNNYASFEHQQVDSAIPRDHLVSAVTENTESKIHRSDEAEILQKEYRIELQSIPSIDDLREKIKQFSQLKRSLRLEQRQCMSLPNGADKRQQLQAQLEILDTKILLIEERILAIENSGETVKPTNSSMLSQKSSPRASSSASNDHSSKPSSSSSSVKPAPMHRELSAAVMKLQQARNVGGNSSANTSANKISAVNNSAKLQSETTTSVDDLLRDVDRILRKGQQLLEVGRQSSTGLVDVSTLLVTLSSVEKKIQASPMSISTMQNLGYQDRLSQLHLKLQELLKVLQNNPSPLSSAVESSRSIASKPVSRVSSANTSKRSSQVNESKTTEIPITKVDAKDSIGSTALIQSTLQRQVSLSEQVFVERIDQDVNALNSHTVLATSESAPGNLSSAAFIDVDASGAKEVESDDAVPSGPATEDDEDEEDPEKLNGWLECINSSLFYSAAHHAAYFGFTEVLQFLCKYFDCFVMDEKGRTPLFYAALNNQLKCVAHLLGMDPRWIDVGDHNGDTLLHAAAMALNNSSSDTNHQASPNCEVLEFLLSCEASPDIANHQGMTPSHIAKSVAALKVLAKYNAQLYCMDSRGRLPIWHACFDNRIECVRFLLTKTPRSYILWPDETEGDNCLHVAAKQGHAECIESVLSFFFDSSSTESEGASNNGPTGDDCLYSTNKRQYSIAHCASNSMVLRVLYEFGMNLFITDAKDHMPLFIMSFYNRLDCVVYLLDMATSSTSAMKNSSVSQKKSSYNIAHADRQRDTALHISCVAGHGGVAQILLLFLSNEAMKNTQGFRPSDLARKAGNVQLADCVEYYETVFRPTTPVGDSSIPPLLSKNELMQKIFHSVVTYGSRWTKCFDLQYDAMYYFDHVTNEAVWERPPGFDLPRHDDEDFDKALNLLRKFYKKHNPDKMVQINDILFLYRRRYTELFITLAQRYSLSDLSMFKGIYFHDGTVPQSSQGPFSPPPSTNQLGPKKQ